VFSIFLIVPFRRKCGKNVAEQVRPPMTVRTMRIACWIPEATNTYTQVV